MAFAESVTPFVGRAVELEEISQLLTAAMRAPSSLLLLRGEAGVGKTVLLQEALEDLAGPVSVVAVHADELTRSIPHAALINAISELRAGSDHETIRLAGELLDALVDVSPTSGGSFAPAVRLFSALQDRGPTVVAVDDLQDLDDDTVALFSGLLRRADRHPMIVLGTIRTATPDPNDAVGLFIERMAREQRLTIVDVLPIDHDGVSALVEAVLGVPGDGDLVALVENQSSGNPFFAIQVLLGLMESAAVDVGQGATLRQGQHYELSPDRRTAVLQRVFRVGAPARALAGALAVLRSISLVRLEVAATISGLPDSDAHAALDILVERGIVSVDDGVVVFGHDLVCDALYESLRPAQRLRMHRDAARLLDSQPAGSVLHTEVARHVAQVATHGDERAIDVLTGEADRACRVGPRTAIPWYERALRLTPQEWPRHAEIQSRLARALYLAGRPSDAAEVGQAALAAMERSPGRDRLVLLVVEALTEIGDVAAAVSLVDDERGHERSGPRLAAQAATIYWMAGRRRDADKAFAEALNGLDEASPGDRLNVLSHLCQSCFLAGNSDFVVTLGERVLEASEELPPNSRLSAYASLSSVLGVIGSATKSAEVLKRAQVMIEGSELGLFRGELAVTQARNAYHLGDWDNVLELAESMEGELDETGSHAHLAALHDLQASVLANRGQWPAARRVLEHDEPVSLTLSLARVSTLAEVDRTAGEYDSAIDRLHASLARTELPIGLRTMMLALRADIEADAQRYDDVALTLSELEAVGVASTDLVSKLLRDLAFARATGDLDRLGEVQTKADKARFALLQAKVHLYRGVLDERTEDNLRKAIRMFHSLGAIPWRRRAAAELRARGLPVPRHRATPSGFLTETELQVARLVQLGRTNREIALTVCLSVKTVEAYLTRIYAKTGTSNRLELALTLEKGELEAIPDPT